jgi:hypothetical protein
MQAPKLIGDPRGENRACEPTQAAPAGAEPKSPESLATQLLTGGFPLESRQTGVELPVGIYRS